MASSYAFSCFFDLTNSASNSEIASLCVRTTCQPCLSRADVYDGSTCLFLDRFNLLIHELDFDRALLQGLVLAQPKAQSKLRPLHRLTHLLTFVRSSRMSSLISSLSLCTFRSASVLTAASC